MSTRRINSTNPMSLSRKKSQSLAIAGLLFATVLSASADLIHVLPAMGNLQNSTVFSLGGGVAIDRFSQDSYIEGDVRVAGNGNITLSGNATIDGDLYRRSNGTLKTSGNATITGTVYNNNDAELDAGVTAAINASNDAFALAPTIFLESIWLRKSQSMTISGAPGATVVLRLRDFRLSGSATLTLQGTATTTFIINVTRQFSLSGKARILLSGVQWNNVLFNVRPGPGTVSIKGNASLQGILMANQRTVSVGGHSTVTGAIIANTVLLRGSARVLHPPITSP